MARNRARDVGINRIAIERFLAFDNRFGAELVDPLKLVHAPLHLCVP
jgi:hypothetical protein